MQPHSEQAPILVSKIEAAKLLGICLRTVDSLIANKQIPCRKIGRRTLIPFSALLAFARRDHVTTTELAQ
jgi:excisionase family DNA binding protein